MPNARQYELVYIVAPTATDAELEALQGEFNEQIETLGGTVESTDLWGRRKLAYAIGPFTEGIYVVQLINGPGEMISELGRRLRVRDQVLRYLTVRVDEDLRKTRRAAEKRKPRTGPHGRAATPVTPDDRPKPPIDSDPPVTSDRPEPPSDSDPPVTSPSASSNGESTDGDAKNEISEVEE